MDSIMIKGLRVYAYHGVKPEEKEKGQRFELDITLKTDLRPAGKSDALADTVNYSAVTKRAVAVMNEAKYDLIEKAAARVAQVILEEFPAALEVTVLLKKPNAPVKADFDYMAVEITRHRGF